MKFKNVFVLILFVSVFVFMPQTKAEPYPLDYFALREVISNVSMSPDGSKISLLKIPSKKGQPILEIYDANDLSKEPFRVNANPMEIRRASWVSNDQLLLSLRQKIRNKIEGYNQGVYGGALAKLDLKTKKIKKFELDNQSPGIASILVDKPNKILIAFDGDNRFSPADYYELDLNTGRKKLLMKGTPAVPLVVFDAYGDPMYGQSFDRASGEIKWYVRYSGSKQWTEIHQQSENSFEEFDVEGYDEANRDIFFVSAHNGENTKGLWEFNIKTKTFGEAIYRRKNVDLVHTPSTGLSPVKFHSNSWTNPETVVGVRYATDKVHTEFFDGEEEALYKQLEGLIPHSHQLSVTSRSRDGKSLIVYNSGPRDPGTFYMIKNGQVKTIGSIQPLLESSNLADVKYMKYKSRDGKKMAMYVTVPNGTGPFPTVVMPHGGPFVQEVVGYDEWAQMLANNGYMVIQPEYRGSLGYGQEHYMSSFIDGGEAGYKMQDDKDDAALYLVKQGMADPERLAMFGWSYGGYAALIAASREDQIYQCAIAGAAVADMVMQVNYYYSRLRGAQLEQQIKYRKGSVNPIDVAENVNIPLFVIHGSVDQRVPVDHAKKYLKLLEKYEKNHKYLELDGADHFSSSLSFDHQSDLYNGIINYLKTDCGPGGL